MGKSTSYLQKKSLTGPVLKEEGWPAKGQPAF